MKAQNEINDNGSRQGKNGHIRFSAIRALILAETTLEIGSIDSSINHEPLTTNHQA